MVHDCKRLVITIDGPAGSGKSTTARRVAQVLGYVYLDSGAMYRAVTLAVIQNGVSFEDDEAVCRIADSIDIEFRTLAQGQQVFLNHVDVTDLIRTPAVTDAIGPVAANEKVRARLVPKQRMLGRNGAIVAEGRDMGTVVFPEADLKIFLVASLQARAHRRFQELKDKGMTADYDEILTSMQKRDIEDSSREHGPLKMADDAVYIDTSDMSIEQQVEKVLQETRLRGA